MVTVRWCRWTMCILPFHHSTSRTDTNLDSPYICIIFTGSIRFVTIQFSSNLWACCVHLKINRFFFLSWQFGHYCRFYLYSVVHSSILSTFVYFPYDAYAFHILVPFVCYTQRCFFSRCWRISHDPHRTLDKAIGEING